MQTMCQGIFYMVKVSKGAGFLGMSEFKQLKK